MDVMKVSKMTLRGATSHPVGHNPVVQKDILQRRVASRVQHDHLPKINQHVDQDERDGHKGKAASCEFGRSKVSCATLQLILKRIE